MNTFGQVEQPRQRHKIRRLLGREFYILKRRWRWLSDSSSYASYRGDSTTQHTQIHHRSFLLRPLKNVDMHLQHNKVTNLRLAIANINGIVIAPGQKFSIWKMVGRPTKQKGYLEGLVLHNGQISSGIGGGLCQLGNLLYWMTLHTDLDVTERWRHSYDVFPDINRSIPFACGATLAYNYIDLEITNNTDRHYSIHLWLDDEYLNGEIRSNEPPEHTFEVYETDHQIRQQWWGGYTRHNRIWKRKKAQDDTIVSESLVTENHAIMMYNPLLEKL